MARLAETTTRRSRAEAKPDTNCVSGLVSQTVRPSYWLRPRPALARLAVSQSVSEGFPHPPLKRRHLSAF